MNGRGGSVAATLNERERRRCRPRGCLLRAEPSRAAERLKSGRCCFRRGAQAGAGPCAPRPCAAATTTAGVACAIALTAPGDARRLCSDCCRGWPPAEGWMLTAAAPSWSALPAAHRSSGCAARLWSLAAHLAAAIWWGHKAGGIVRGGKKGRRALPCHGSVVQRCVRGSFHALTYAGAERACEAC